MIAPRVRSSHPPKSGTLSASRELQALAPQSPATEDVRPAAEPVKPDQAAPREELIRTAAYLRSERRGFEAGHELDDWLTAEREVDLWIESRGAPHRYRR